MIIDAVLWVAVSLLCLRCLNKDKEIEEEWNNTNIWIRVLGFIFIPFLYVAATLSEAFKK